MLEQEAALAIENLGLVGTVLALALMLWLLATTDVYPEGCEKMMEQIFGVPDGMIATIGTDAMICITILVVLFLRESFW